MGRFPEIVTFRLTSRCNNDCKYCYAPRGAMKEMRIAELQRMFDLFCKSGVKAIVLTGGEPLVRQDFAAVIEELDRRRIRTFLDTSGDFFSVHSEQILNKVEVLGLPIDFPDKSYRNPDNLGKVLKALESLKKRKQRPVIRIGTVVTKDNISELEKIGALIKEYPVDIWKIYEFVPQNANAIENKRLLEISEREFDEASRKAKEKFSKYFDVVISKRKDRTNAYFFVNPDGEVFMPVDDLDICREVRIGNVFEEDIVDKWEMLVSKDNYRENARVTFNYKQ